LSEVADICGVRVTRKLIVPLALAVAGLAVTVSKDGWTGFVFFAAAVVWTLGVAADAWILPALGLFRQADKWSRRLIAVEATTLIAWAGWGLLETVAGPPWLSFLAFGLVSLPVGAVLLVLSLVGLAGASADGQPKRYGVAAACLSFVIGVLPFVTLLSLDGGSMS
jgi:hypothetical protein